MAQRKASRITRRTAIESATRLSISCAVVAPPGPVLGPIDDEPMFADSHADTITTEPMDQDVPALDLSAVSTSISCFITAL
jgi:hypothetical protein